MIDPKFNELPDETETGIKKPVPTGLADENRPERTAARTGLSINDTIAGDASLSVGGRGADTSGVRAGSGAGAGSSFVTPGARGESPAPNVRPGPAGSGATPLSDAATEQTATQNDAEDTLIRSASEEDSLSADEVASHAYQCWHERGCPVRSSEEDWHRAERELRERRRITKSSTATA